MGDSVQGNQVFTDGTPCTGTSGPLGSLSHTYADPGVKNICVIVYDMLKNQDGSFPSSGAHGDKAGGADRNTDNSVEQNELKGESICLSPEIPVEVPKTASIHVVKLPLNQVVDAANPNATFHYAVTANGDVPLTDVTLGDDKCPDVTATGGDTNDDQILDTDEIWTYDCTVAVFADQTNTATATGHYGDTTVTDTAQADTIVAAQQSGSASPILTAPPTDSVNGQTSDAGGTLPLMLIVLGVIGLGAVVLTPSRKKR